MQENLLKTMVGELEEASKDLQVSLLSRDTERIWANLAKQDQVFILLARFQHESADELEKEILRDPELRQLLKRSRTVVQTNRVLTQRFLAVIRQTLSHLGGGESSTYAVPGASPVRRAPVFVHQQG